MQYRSIDIGWLDNLTKGVGFHFAAAEAGWNFFRCRLELNLDVISEEQPIE